MKLCNGNGRHNNHNGAPCKERDIYSKDQAIFSCHFTNATHIIIVGCGQALRPHGVFLCTHKPPEVSPYLFQ